MRLRWLGVTGTALLLTSLVLMAVGPRIWPSAFFNVRAGAMSGGMMAGGQGGMMSGGMMSGGMMSGGMMAGGMMAGGMMAGGQGGMMSGGMMAGGMMAGGQGGMMSGGMMAEPGAMPSMMSGEVGGDPAHPFDLRFLDQMLPHHQMAGHSAQMMISGSERPELRDLAQRIISAQQAEIGQMGQWRTSWFPNASAASSMPMMGSQGGMMGSQGGMMGGQGQMDRLFLEMMIPHHQAAIDMARQALDESQRPEIRSLAEAIISTQTAEIAEMRGYLRDFFGATTP